MTYDKARSTYLEILSLVPYDNKKDATHIKEIITDSLLSYKLHDYKLNKSERTASFIIQLDDPYDIADTIQDIIDTYRILGEEDRWKVGDLPILKRNMYTHNDTYLGLKLVSIYGVF